MNYDIEIEGSFFDAYRQCANIIQNKYKSGAYIKNNRELTMDLMKEGYNYVLTNCIEGEPYRQAVVILKVYYNGASYVLDCRLNNIVSSGDNIPQALHEILIYLRTNYNYLEEFEEDKFYAIPIEDMIENKKTYGVNAIYCLLNITEEQAQKFNLSGVRKIPVTISL